MNHPSQPTYLVAAHTEKGPVRPRNEDAYWIPDETTPLEVGALYVVADGVGGQEEGAAAAQLAVLMIREAYYRSRQNGRSIPEALARAIHRANQAIYEEAQTRGARRMGCTLVAAALDGDDLYLAHVGDARAYLTRQGKLERLTKDDTWVEKQVEAGLISPEQAAQHELRNIVTQVLGNKPEIEINQQQQKLPPGETLLLCSDGLYDRLDNARLYQIIRQQPPAAAAPALVQAAIAAETTDNVTAILIHNPPLAAPAGAASPSPIFNRSRLLILLAVILLGLALLLWRILSPGPAEPALISATATLPPSATPALYACVIALPAYVWQDAQIEQAASCDHTVQDLEYSLEINQELLVLNPEPRDVRGPDNGCTLNPFINVQSVDNPEIEGWILSYIISTPAPGRGCPDE